MDERRRDPDALLKEIQRQEGESGLGQLKIFFGYAAGVGKTYSMLQAAHAAKLRGADVVVGYVEPHARPQTLELLNGLEAIPAQRMTYNGIELRELDLDAAMERKPEILIVDELAHTNAEGCRHNKRYRDVEELLKAGIDVYTTVNVQHIESLNDMVASITGVIVRERIPDKVFDNADQVELVDIEPQELIERLNEGKIYIQKQAKRALSNFFSTDNLTALREIALRRCADRVNLLTDTARAKTNGEFFTDEHILVCLSSSPTNGKIIRTAARMAQAFKGGFTALFVQTPDFAYMSEENKRRLRANIRLAERLGATVETLYGDDVAFQISEFARLSGVSKIVVGRNNARRKSIFSKPTLVEQLVSNAPNLDVYIIPDRQTPLYKIKKRYWSRARFVAADLIKSLLILTAATLISALFDVMGFSEANIITIYILGVLVTAVVTTRRVYSLALSIVSVLVYNFFFTDPRFTLNAYGYGYPFTFAIMFIAAFITSTLAVRIKQHARQSAQTAFRTKILFDTNQLLQQAEKRDEIVSVTANQLIKLLDRDVVFYCEDMGELTEPRIFAASEAEKTGEEYTTENERAVAFWTYKNNKHAGATTDTLSSAQCLYLAVRTGNTVCGVVGIVIGDVPLDAFENSVVLSVLGECALAMESEKSAREKEETAVMAKNEQLRANLLRSISHDLRTPLTSISGNAGILMSGAENIDAVKKMQLYSDIYDDSMWLINLVENLLSVTRIEDGSMSLKLSAELMEEVIAEALSHVNRKRLEHNITVREAEGFILAKMDARLIVQVIINIVDNAIKYTPRGSEINISTYKRADMVWVDIADDGPGIADDIKPKVFDMFYAGTNKIADNRRSLGLGLALCKSIINAHGGEISVADNAPRGTIFRFSLPSEEVELHE